MHWVLLLHHHWIVIHRLLLSEERILLLRPVLAASNCVSFHLHATEWIHSRQIVASLELIHLVLLHSHIVVAHLLLVLVCIEASKDGEFVSCSSLILWSRGSQRLTRSSKNIIKCTLLVVICRRCCLVIVIRDLNV